MAKNRMLMALLAALGAISAGAARGDTTFIVQLGGDQEVPPNNSTATGVCVAVLNDAQNELAVTCTHNVQNVTASHIHRAPRGSNGGVVFPFNSAVSPIQGTWMNMTNQNVQDLFAGNLYVNVHSQAFGGGELRGQLVRGLEAFHYLMGPDQEVPPNNSDALGTCVGLVNAAETEFAVRCEHTAVNPTASHIHNAPRGQNGGVVFNLGSPVSPIENTWQNLTEQNVEDLRDAAHYVNVHSSAFPGGEVRGQIEHGGPCTGAEKPKASCKGRSGKGKAKAVAKRAAPNAVVTFCFDAGDCVTALTNGNGKAKQVWKKLDAAGDRTVTFHYACGDVDAAVVSCP